MDDRDDDWGLPDRAPIKPRSLGRGLPVPPVLPIVAAIGGSITAGGMHTKDPMRRYVQQLAKWFEKMMSNPPPKPKNGFQSVFFPSP